MNKFDKTMVRRLRTEAVRPWLCQGVSLRETKLVPARARRRTRGIVVRGLCPLRPPGAQPPLDPHKFNEGNGMSVLTRLLSAALTLAPR